MNIKYSLGEKKRHTFYTLSDFYAFFLNSYFIIVKMKTCNFAINSEMVNIGKKLFFNYCNFLSIISMNCLITIFIDLQ